jgi:pimeloyl-ACP methyl ester carboxylesterase
MIEANGLNHFVVDQGDGPAVVLLHGFPDSAEMWRRQVPPIVEAGYRVIAPDLRGFGDSDKPEGVDNYTIFNAVADTRTIMESLGLERAHIVGHDYGAGVAWLTASLEPALVDKLAVLSVGHPGTVTRPLFGQMQLSWYTFFFQFEATAEAALEKDDWSLMRQWLASSPDRDSCLANLQRPGALTAGLSWYRANMRPEIWGTEIPFPEVTAPTMGIWGERDAFLTESQMTDSVQFCSGEWRYERINGAGHWLMLDEPDEVNALLLDFLAG